MQLPNIQSFIGEYVLLWKHQGRGFKVLTGVLFKFEWYSPHAQVAFKLSFEVLYNSVFGKTLIELYKFGSSAVVKKLNFRSYLKIFVS